ncbi:hypothetical protein [Bacillus mojavensis]
MSERKELQQTASYFKFIGKATRLDKDFTYREDLAEKGKNKGKTFRSLNFGVKTSDTNEMSVQMFSFEPEKVFLWNSEMAKEAKEKNKEYKGTRVDFDEWYENQEKFREDGYAVLQSRIGLERDEKGNAITRGLPTFVASKELYEGLDNGDSVFVEGNISYSIYEKNGKSELRTNYNIEKLYITKKPVDFEDEKFKEVTYFEQQFVFVSAELVKKEKKAYITGRTISYTKDFTDVQFVIDYKNPDYDPEDEESPETIKALEKLAKNLTKKVKFGDLLKVWGTALNRVDVIEVEDEENEEEGVASALGGMSKPQHAKKNTFKSYTQEMQIEGVDEWIVGEYKEEDFVKQSLVDEEDEDENEEEDHKEKKIGSNPFESDDDDDDDEDDDDLPF